LNYFYEIATDVAKLGAAKLVLSLISYKNIVIYHEVKNLSMVVDNTNIYFKVELSKYTALK